jgi:hypothetical protein
MVPFLAGRSLQQVGLAGAGYPLLPPYPQVPSPTGSVAPRLPACREAALPAAVFPSPFRSSGWITLECRQLCVCYWPYSCSVGKAENRAKSRSSVSRARTQASRQRATICASETRLPAAFASRMEQQVRERGARQENRKTRREQDARQRRAGFLGSEGGRKESGVGDNSKELAEHEDGQRPARAAFSEGGEARGGRVMLRKLLAVGVIAPVLFIFGGPGRDSKMLACCSQ